MIKKQFTLDLIGAAEDVKQEDKLVILPYIQEDIGAHDHKFFELVYITGGTTYHTLNESTQKLSAGNYFIVDLGSTHRYSKSKNLTLINCLFLPETIDEGLKGCFSFEELVHSCLIRYYKLYLGKQSANRIFYDADGSVLRLMEGMMSEYSQKEMGYQEIFRCRLLEIMILTLRSITGETVDYPNTLIQEIFSYIHIHYSDSHILSGFCEEYHYAPQYISRKFPEETGFTIMEYVQKVRMEKSCELLAGTGFQVWEIAQKVGYADMKFFNQVFKKFIKMTPTEYRKLFK